MKSILLIVDTFPPYAAPRMGVLCKYLKKNGWQPYVVVSDDLSLGKYSENLVGYAEAHFIPKRSSTPMSRFLNRVRQRYAAQTVPFVAHRIPSHIHPSISRYVPPEPARVGEGHNAQYTGT